MISTKRYEVLNGLPPYGPMYVPFSPDEKPFYSEGYVVKFKKPNGDEWVGNFMPGWTYYNNVFELQKDNLVVVFSGGQGYVINVDQEKLIFAFGITINDVIQKDDGGLICSNDTHILIIDSENGEIRQTERISWDGIKDLKLVKNTLHGKSYDSTNDFRPWINFTLDLETNKISGGSFVEFLTKNQNLEVLENGMLNEKKVSHKKPWWKIW